ncbi:PIR Superfamily Protein [Plasmodium ovale curtisi]|uniref:PIR Superfamily Protein n=1 Tax=Plasmodium ovale curtisi TaxID=864141 RepID=A0A1A8WAH8_PLAOA|nr:PIR Superfamily Protein [Plasmodium ovale curtisi]
MTTAVTNNCELPSDKCYSNFDKVQTIKTSTSVCDSDENISLGNNPLSIQNLLSRHNDLKDFCYKLEINLQNLKNEQHLYHGLKETCTHLQLWLHDKIINTVDTKSIMLYITIFHTVWGKVIDNSRINNKNECKINYYNIGVDYYTKWKRMHDFNYNYKKVQCAFQDKENCKDDCNEDCKGNCKEVYCRYILDVFNAYKEFEHVCTGTNNYRCPEFWGNFKNNFSIYSDIESKCKDIYDKFGFYKLSFFGSKIAPKADDMRKMWRNVQGVTNPASLLNPMKPPGGGNKMGLPYLPK